MKSSRVNVESQSPIGRVPGITGLRVSVIKRTLWLLHAFGSSDITGVQEKGGPENQPLTLGLLRGYEPVQGYPEDGLSRCLPWAGCLAPIGCQAMVRARAGFVLSSTWGSKVPVGQSLSLSLGKITNCD